MKSHRTRRGLDFKNFSNAVFNEELNEFMEIWMQKEFFTHSLSVDYGLRVLSQEVFLRIFMDVTKKNNIKEVDALLAPVRMAIPIEAVEGLRNL